MSESNKDFNPADNTPPALEDAVVTSPVVMAYAAKVGETFRTNGTTELKLLKAEPSVKFKVAPGQQPPDVPVGVKLVFEGPDASELPEGTYVVEAGDQQCHLHLIPIQSPVGMQLYQAVHDE
ncbi:MAG: hypothetical protein H7Z12_04730 [Rhodospirillaceae bacterium]|nr:hypothetical protein [Rhodospirillales bacterium]